MKTRPERWTTPGAARADEARAGLLLRRAVVRQPLDARALDDVRERLREAPRPASRRLVLRFGVALALFLAGGGVVASATLLGHWSPFSRPAAPQPAPVSPTAHHRVAVVPPVPAAPAVTPPAAPPIAAPTVAAPAAPARPPRARAVETAPEEPAAPVVNPPAAAPSAIAEEAALLAAALRGLRESGDAAGALALLDEHDRRFGVTGPLAAEARTTRVEALLRLSRFTQALVLLDTLDPRPTGRGRALLATRGELRADARRCPEAVADFDALLADASASDDTAERALYGRAACRSRLGDAEAARADLDAYLARFPAGRYAARARTALER
jgi:hypothetical protein